MIVEVVVALAAGAVGLAVGLAVRRNDAPPDHRRAASATTAPVAPAATRVDERFAEVLDVLAIGVVVCDRDGRVRHRNSAARAFAGTHAGVLVDDAVERLVAGALAGEPSEQLVELYGPPKQAVLVRAGRLQGGGAYALVDDVSERRRTEAVRTDFVANISHELKTPVGALAVLAETLAGEHDPDIIQRLANRLADESHRASRTIDDLLELSRIELSGGGESDAVEIDAVVAAAVERAVPLAQRRQIRVSSLGSQTGLSIVGDRRQIVSALGNLVENAVKYSEPDGLVQVRARATGDWIELMVADQGVGIPAGDLQRIFERFYRVDKARSRGTGGSGLGLSIVRHVATNHGGDVLVSSREGEGSTFVLKLPRDRQLAAGESGTTSGADTSKSGRSDTSSESGPSPAQPGAS